MNSLYFMEGSRACPIPSHGHPYSTNKHSLYFTAHVADLALNFDHSPGILQ